jgi:hypothetical protein
MYVTKPFQNILTDSGVDCKWIAKTRNKMPHWEEIKNYSSLVFV